MVHETATERQPVLPVSIVEPADVTRLLRELEDVDDFMRQTSVRKSGNTIVPKTTRALRELTEANGWNLLQSLDRAHTTSLLEQVHKAAPVVHISFASGPSAVFIEKIMTYLRQNIHPFLLVQIGLQPTIAAGCVVRTTNKVFDFSLRQHLTAHRELLITALANMHNSPQPDAAPDAAQPARAQQGAGQ